MITKTNKPTAVSKTTKPSSNPKPKTTRLRFSFWKRLHNYFKSISQACFNLFNRIQIFFQLTPQQKLIRHWLIANHNKIKNLLLQAHQLKINLNDYIPNYQLLFSIKKNRILTKNPNLTLDECKKILNVNLQSLNTKVGNLKLHNWKQQNLLFFKWFIRLNMKPDKFIPFFNENFRIIDDQINQIRTSDFNIEQIIKATDLSVTKLINKTMQKTLITFLNTWLKKNHVVLESWYNILQNDFFSYDLIPIEINQYFFYKNETVSIKKKFFEPQKVFELIDYNKLQMQKMNEKIFHKFKLLKKFNVWFVNNYFLLKEFVKSNIPFKLIDTNLIKYINLKTLGLAKKFYFDEQTIIKIISFTGFKIKQIINYHLMRDWIRKNEIILLSWSRINLSYKIIFPGLDQKIVAHDNQVLIRKGVILQDLLVQKVINLSPNILETAYNVYKNTKKLSQARDTFNKKNWLKRLWTSLWSKKIQFETDDIPKLSERINLNYIDNNNPPIHDFISFKNNKNEYKKMRKYHSNKILYKNQVVGLVDADILPNEYIIEVKNMSKYFVTGQKVNRLFYNFNLRIKRNDFVVVLGPSGSGKTSLLNILSGLDQADSGDVFSNGKNLTLLNNNDLTLFRRKYVSFIFQNYNLLPNLTALENVEVGAYLLPKGRPPFDIYELFETLEIDSQKNNYPSQLSGGQQQRVAIARALSKHPQLLFCDEPTGALDQKMSKTVLKTLLDINRIYKMTIILITHNAEFAKIADSVIYIKDGRIEKYESSKSPTKVDDLKW